MKMPFSPFSSILCLFFLAVISSSALRGEPAAIGENPSATAEAAVEEESVTGLEPSWLTRGGAKTLDVTLPAPRGQIVDRNGRALATNRVAYFPALKFPKMDGATDREIASFGAAGLAELNRLCFGTDEAAQASYWQVEPAEFVQHYQNRRWLPFLFVGRYELKAQQKEAVEKDLTSYGLIAHPVYVRHYPLGKLACHIIGYTGLKLPLPTTPLENGDPLYFIWEGKSGLEAAFEEELAGTPGRLNIIFDKDGKEIERDLLQQPVAGKTLVTTLDANMQALAEEILYHRSSMVLMDCHTGDIFAMASNPGYDLNTFVPSISQDQYSKLIEDADKPLYGRAFQASYPPASTFKLPIAIAALKSGTITPDSHYGCPARLRIGNQSKANWHASGEGSMNMQKAIARSCNTWFYQVGMKVGAEPLIREARNFGFGQLTRIPLDESQGLLPTNSWMMENFGHNMYSGDVANFSIGQGYVEATPLQVAQSMTGIANGKDIWRAQLIKQKQDHANNVLEMTAQESIGRVEMSDKLLAAIRRGMVDVVHAGYGTGKQGYCSYAQIAAKTGTAEWKGNKRMTWFAGFIPANDPQFSFAIAFEGGSSGGSTVAPLAKNFFNGLYGRRDPDADLFAEVRVPGDGDEADSSDEDKDEAKVASSGSSNKKRTRKRPARAQAAPQPQPQPQAPPPTVPAKPKKRSFFDRLLGR